MIKQSLIKRCNRATYFSLTQDYHTNLYRKIDFCIKDVEYKARLRLGQTITVPIETMNDRVIENPMISSIDRLLIELIISLEK